MMKLAARVGMWAAILETACAVTYIVGLIILMAMLFSQRSPAEVAAQPWVGIRDYAAHYADDPLALTIGTIVQISAFASALSILVVFLALHEMTAPAKQILTRISSAFALALVITSCLSYYVQWASVHQTIMHSGDLEGLGQFVEANASSPAMASLQLGWAFFYGLTTLVVIPIFGSQRIEKLIRGAFLINGVIGVTVGVLYAFGVDWVMLISVLGLVATAFAYPLLAIRFYRLARMEPRVASEVSWS